MKSIKANQRVSRPALLSVAGLCAAIGVIFITLAGAATALIGDVNNDGKVDVFDLSVMITRWGTADPAADLNANGKVDVFDLSILLAHWGQTGSTPGPVTPTPPPGTPGPISGVSASTPCVGSPAPAKWKHVVVLMFENQTYNNVIGSQSPFITGLANKCATYTNWHDANFKVNGSSDGNYISKPNYATLFSGVPPSVHGLGDDSFGTTTGVDNIFNRLFAAGKTTKSYQSGSAGQCGSSNFSGAYHDALRYFTNVSSKCNANDVTMGQFMTDVNAGTLPDLSVIYPTNGQNMHDNSVSSGDSWANSFLTPFLNSAQYKSGDTALFFLWDEDTPIPNALIAPSIKPGTKPVPTGSTYAFSHFSALRTWQEMLGITPLLGYTGQAPSLLPTYNGQ